ncbi:MAG: hypothetical protein F4049_15690, partial [Gemmatimonadetes bacterium]|nr:hypothetical protein [Gemmatimonadota bacterium]
MKIVAIAGTALLTASAAWCQAYQLDANGLNVAPEHWSAWSFPPGSLDFSDEGVRPAFIREQVNAVLDASAFTYGDGGQGGIRSAGTDLAGAANI